MTRQRFNLSMRAKAVEDGEQMLVFGFLSVAELADGTRVVDSHGDTIAISELEKAAYGYVADARGVGLEHRVTRGIGRLVESCVFTPEKLKALGLSEDSLPRAWWVGMKIDDPATWAKVKSGELSMLSWGGWASRGVEKSRRAKAADGDAALTEQVFELTNLEIDEGSLVAAGANPGANVCLWKSRETPMPLLSKTREMLAKMFRTEKMGMGAPAADATANPPSTADLLAQREWLEEWWDLRCAFEDSVTAILSAGLSPEDTSARLRETTQQFLDALTQPESAGAMKALGGQEKVDAALSAVLAGATTESMQSDIHKTFDLLEEEAGAVVRHEEKTTMPKTIDQIVKSISADDAAVLSAELAKAKQSDTGEEGRKALDAIRKENEALRVEVEAQKSASRLLEKRSVVKEFSVPGMTHDSMADMLFKLDGTPAHDAMVASWKATTDALKPLMAPVGKAGTTDAQSPDEAAFQKAVEQNRAAGMSEGQALAKAFMENKAAARKLATEARELRTRMQ